MRGGNVRKIWYWTLASLLILVALLVACVAKEPAATPAPISKAVVPPATTQKPAEQPPSRAKPGAEIDELAVPNEWIEGAKKEGKLRVMSTIDPPEFELVAKHFRERYPFIKDISYTKASHEVRAVKTVVEFKQGRVSFDVVTGLGGAMPYYKEAKALADLRPLPVYAMYPSHLKDPEGHWIAKDVAYWGIGYNTKLVKKEDLPKTWEELADPKWKGKQIALGNRPQLYTLMLWKHWGPEKTKDFFKKLFANGVQLRKEGLNAMVDLLAAGEWKMHIPAAPYRVRQMADEGGPVDWYSPEPLLVAGGEMGMLNNSPNPNAGRLFVNWYTSKEGASWLYKETYVSPAHPALQTPEFLPYPEAMMNRKWSFRSPEDEVLIQPVIEEFWNTLWIEK
jgi:ABC-type Fe3+ transport system substrate-binding protein